MSNGSRRGRRTEHSRAIRNLRLQTTTGVLSTTSGRSQPMKRRTFLRAQLCVSAAAEPCSAQSASFLRRKFHFTPWTREACERARFFTRFYPERQPPGSGTRAPNPARRAIQCESFAAGIPRRALGGVKESLPHSIKNGSNPPWSLRRRNNLQLRTLPSGRERAPS